MDTTKLTTDELRALLDEEKIPVQAKETKHDPYAMDDAMDDAMDYENGITEAIRRAVRGLSAYDGYLAGMVIRNVWQAWDLKSAHLFLHLLMEEMKHDD